MATRATFPAGLEKTLRAVFGASYTRYPAEYSNIYQVISSTKAFERFQQISGLGTWKTKAEMSDVEYDDAVQGPQTVLTNVTYGLGAIISQEQIEDGQYRQMTDMMAALGNGGHETVEIVGANTYNNAASTSYPGADGKSLASATHPLYKKSGSTFSNYNPTGTALTHTSLWNAIVQAQKITDDAGLKINITRGRIVLVVPPELEKIAIQLTEAIHHEETDGGSTTHRFGNIIRKSGRNVVYAVCHYLTSTTNWFLYFPDVQNGMIFQWRVRPQFRRDEKFVQGARFRARQRFQVGWADPRAVYMQAGA